MRRARSIIAIGIIGVLAIAGCSGPSAVETPVTNESNPADQQATPAVDRADPVAPVGAVAPAGVVDQVSAVGGAAPAIAQAAPVSNEAAIAPPAAATATADGNYITAQGVGKVTGTPDVVTIVLGVTTTSDSAQNALNDNNTKAADVISVLKSNGVAAADLQTSSLSVNPTYDNQGQRITGYQVSNMVTAKLRDISAAGALIDAVGKSAGDAIRVQQLSFSIDDDSALRATARTDAVKRASTQAKQLADAAGVALGPVHSITETPAQTPIMYPTAMAASAPTDSSVPIEPGSVDLTVVVQVVYQIAQ